MSIPTFYGAPARRALADLWGLPNSYPTADQLEELGPLAHLRGSCRLLFVDDDDDGRPVAFWRGRIE